MTCKAFAKFEDCIWKVGLEPVDGYIHIYAKKSLIKVKLGRWTYVNPKVTFFDKLWGSKTPEEKVEHVKQSVQNWCDKKNKKEVIAKELIENLE